MWPQLVPTDRETLSGTLSGSTFMPRHSTSEDSIIPVTISGKGKSIYSDKYVRFLQFLRDT